MTYPGYYLFKNTATLALALALELGYLLFACLWVFCGMKLLSEHEVRLSGPSY